MSESETSKVGRRGTVVIPAEYRRRYGMEEGSYIIAEPREDGVLLRPAAVFPVEIYSDRRKAELLLGNAVDDEDYERILEDVRGMGVDPDELDIPPPSRHGELAKD